MIHPNLATVIALISFGAAIAPSAFAGKKASNGLPDCHGLSRKVQSILVLPDALPEQRVAAGLGNSRSLCTTAPNTLAGAIRATRPNALIYLRSEQLDSRDLAALPPRARLITYRPAALPRQGRLASSIRLQRHALASDSAQQLRLYSAYLSRSRRPVVAVVDRKVPALHPGTATIDWARLPEGLAQLCASGSHIMALVSPLRVQQLGHWLSQAPRCRSNWYVTSAARNGPTLKPILKAVAQKKLRAYLLDAIGYYRKQPRLIAAYGYQNLSETPGPEQSAAIRSLYYVFSAVDVASAKKMAAKRPSQKTLQQRRKSPARVYVFRIADEGIILDRKIR